MEKTQKAVRKHAKKIDKETPDELSQVNLTFPKTGETLRLKGKNYKLLVSTGFNSSRMRLVVCVSDTGAGSDLISRRYGAKLIGKFHQGGMPEI